MTHHHFHFVLFAQVLRQLFRQVDGAVLTAGAAERHHQVLEASPLIPAHAFIYQRHGATEKLMHALLLVEVVDYRRVFAGQGFEAFFSSGIREAAAIEDEATTVSRIVLRQASVKRKTENSHRQLFRFSEVRLQPLQLLRRYHAFEGSHQRGQGNGQLDIVEQPAQVPQRKRYALQKKFFAFVKAAKSIRAQRLHDANV